ncbi:anti-sigma factor family protein [Salinithrix halophila]|uniref:Anti-sigma-W factor RsiW n=2 Tax=Salinithrix halophila TaxID=1485204 RepID=A0ABV8JDL1_9BACL
MDRLIQLYVDQEIDNEGHERLRKHVAECDLCRQSLAEMITLVRSLEEIRSHRDPGRPATVINNLIKWAAVYTAILFFVTFGPSLLDHRPVSVDGEQAGSQGTSSVPVDPRTSHREVMVLATQKEKLHIPDSGYIKVMRPRNLGEKMEMDTAWVYPSAIPALAETKNDWVKQIKRLVFVKVPDNETFRTLLTSAGIPLEVEGKGGVEKGSFPASIILTTGEKPRVEIFDFPDNEKNISRWFDKMAATPAIH